MDFHCSGLLSRGLGPVVEGSALRVSDFGLGLKPQDLGCWVGAEGLGFRVQVSQVSMVESFDG